VENKGDMSTKNKFTTTLTRYSDKNTAILKQFTYEKKITIILSFINPLLRCYVPSFHSMYASGARIKIAVSIRLHESNVLRAVELTSNKFDAGKRYRLLSHWDIAVIEQK
jgi:hypothetical protein